MIHSYDGDDMGMQTRSWGPPGWLFLHTIAQNYPWNPDKRKKKYYFDFFKRTGDVLPCRYCRESYQQFIKEPSTRLTLRVLKNRETLSRWLYDIHNKVNKKLEVTDIPPFEEVWNKYESLRSKCTKSPTIQEKVKKGCLDPLKGYRKKCIVNIVDVDEKGNPIKKNFSFGAKKKTTKKGKIILKSIKKSTKKGKKFTATFEINGRIKHIHFGATGYSDMTRHNDTSRRKKYLTRHKKDLGTGNPARAGFLSTFILWNKKSLRSSISDYKRRLNIYNRTGKFPSKIN
jgi:hypothetical protein